MSQESKNHVNRGLEQAKNYLSIFFLLAGIIAFYYLSSASTIARVGALFGGILLALVIAWFSETGKAFLLFWRDSWREVQKVVWPTRKEAMQMTGVVFAFVIVAALFLWFSDKTLEYLLYDVILGWRR